MSENKIKIFVSAHKPCDFIDDTIFSLVQVGAGLPGRKVIPNALQDNTGDNISDMNLRFCELTAQYWAWKNQDADYYGFFHYRRYLSFAAENEPELDVWGNIIEDSLDEDVIKQYKLDKKSIENLIVNYDVILPTSKDIKKWPDNGVNMREQYAASGYLHPEDLDIMIDVLGEKYPEFMPYANKYINGHITYINNMFIMRKELFNNYCEWLFDILFECDKRIDFSDYSVEAIRTPGHLAERLLNIYVAYLIDKKNIKIKELSTVVFLNTDPQPEFSPAFDNNNIAIGFSANDFFVPYLATVLTSIRENSNLNMNYDIMIMNRDISERNKKRLSDIFSASNNFSLRFINISRYNKRFKKLFTRGHFSIETWFRLLLPEILPNYNKILYLDSDIIVCSDLAELYNENIDGYLLGAAHDADTAGLYNGAETDKKDYMDKNLKIKNPYEYFQAGVLLMNLYEFRKTYTTKEMLEYASSYEFELLDQDVLNYLAQGKVKYIDMSWNVMFDWINIRISTIISKAPKYLYNEYLEARQQPKIIHYAGPDKPWHQPIQDFAEEFWKYARMTVYYEEMVNRMCREGVVFKWDLNSRKRINWKGLKNNFIRSKWKIVDTVAASKLLPEDSTRRKIAQKIYHKIIK